MSKSKSNDTAVTVYDPTRFTVQMPDNAPRLGFDVDADGFNWREVMPSNFWNMDELQERHDALGGWPVLTPARIVVKPVYDPSEWDGKDVPASELTPKLVMEFEESAPALVMNKTRCELASKLTGTPDPRRWAELLGPIELTVGVFNRKAQIGFYTVRGKANGNGNGKRATVEGDPVKSANDDLFG